VKRKVLIGLLVLAVGLTVLMVLVQRSQDTRNRAAGTTSYYCEKKEPTALNEVKSVPFDGDVAACEAALRRGIGTTAYVIGTSNGKCYTDPRSCQSPYTELKQMYFCKDNKCNKTDEKHFSVESCQKEANYYHHYITCTDSSNCGGECTCGNTLDGACCHSYQNENDTGCHNEMGCDISTNTCKYFVFSCDASQQNSQLNCNIQFTSSDGYFGNIKECVAGNSWCVFPKEMCQSHCNCDQVGDWCCGWSGATVEYCNNKLICNETTSKCDEAAVTETPIPESGNRYQYLYSCQSTGDVCSKFDFGVGERYWKTLAECNEMYGNCYLVEDKGKCDTYCLNRTATNTPTPPVTTNTPTPKVAAFTRGSCIENNFYSCTPDPNGIYKGGKTDEDNLIACRGTCTYNRTGLSFARVTYNGDYVCEDTHFRCLADSPGVSAYKGGTTDENRSACQGPDGGCNKEKRYERSVGVEGNNTWICKNGKYQCVENFSSDMNLVACEASCADPKHYSRAMNGNNFICENTKYKCVEDINGIFNWLNTDAGNLANCQGDYNSCTWTTVTPVITMTPTPKPVNYSRAKDANNNLICSYGKYSCYARSDGEYSDYANCQGSCEVRKCSVCADIRPGYVGEDKRGGDYNCDGMLTPADMGIWRTEFLSKNIPKTRWEASGNCFHDINKYFETTIYDYSLWRTNYTNSLK